MKKFSLIALLLGVFLATTAQFVGVYDTPFNCTMSSTATAITEITDCAVLTSGQKRYITDIYWSSSIISTTVNFMLLTAGTGTACATSGRTVYAGFIPAAFTSVFVPLKTPIITDANDALCFTHPGAGTKVMTITGFLR